jgi:AcrR family transcriptional regulator
MAQNKRRLELPKQTTRERVLDAAERLLGQGGAAFSMRDLAEEAGLSFATPFNQFGSKGAIMLALSARRIETMRDRLAQAALPAAAAGRVLAAMDIAAAVMLGAPAVNRAVMAAIGAQSETPGGVASRSGALWADAIKAGAGFAPATRELGVALLPQQLAVTFRGVMSFWTAGELADDDLARRARTAASVVLLGFVGRDGRTELLDLIAGQANGGSGSRPGGPGDVVAEF